jgi:hypothetical protein
MMFLSCKPNMASKGAKGTKTKAYKPQAQEAIKPKMNQSQKGD